ncbi:hypothetical protein [Leifsonia sp. NPDC080035]|uniref:Bacteriocin biosynthesis cyclodehydratase domain-containing protein n=1 Tax=Leifsonia sp. NPDC080035 TaxID=3143936 RepID=A0AAU7G9V6_9MICO
MVYALDPSRPPVWRSPRALQFGVEAPDIVLEDPSIAEERMVAALAGGASRDTLRTIAAAGGAAPEAADALLARLSPVLAAGPRTGPAGLVVLDGAGPTAARILALLHDAGVDARAGLDDDDPALDGAEAAVLVAPYAVAPRRHQRWLRRDVPHLPVVFGDRAVHVGPFVTPGDGPCLRCGDLHRRDADPAWPAIAAQLHARPLPGESELACGAVSSVAAGAVLARRDGRPLPTGVAMRFDRRTLRWSEQRREAHPECGCLSPAAAPAPLVRARPGTATADGPWAGPADSRAATS